VDELLSVAQYRRRLSERDADRAAVIQWLKKNAIPLQSATAESGFTDLQPLRTILKDVRIVALGEATHGTREFFQFKHRMVEFLVRVMGFRVFAIESSYAACFNINEYIMGRSDDGAKALDSQGFWTWNTEEVTAMLDWMRAYNASVPADRKVKFVGFDIQLAERAREVVLAYLRRVAPERVAAYEALPAPAPVASMGKGIEGTLEGLLDSARSSSEPVRKASIARLTEARVSYNELLGFLVLDQARLTRRTSPGEFADALNHVRVIAQFIDASIVPPASTGPMRDYYMAENIERLLDEEPAGTRVVVWAHNFHISSGEHGENSAPYRRMGWYLRQAFGDAYYALGFTFNRGRFQARNNDPEARVKDVGMPLTSFTVGPAPEGFLEWYLAGTGIKNLIVDLRAASKNRAAGAWVATPQQMRYIGATYSVRNESFLHIPVELAKEYDGLVFFDTTSRARPNPSVRNVAGQDE
jgi:erythromycin esterase